MQRLIYFAIALLTTSTALAAPATLARVNVDLWPEYDRSAMLVMIEFELPPSEKLPTVVPLQIPAAVGKPHAVAKRGSDDRLYVAQYTRSVQGAWATLSVTTDSRRFRVEYYDKLVTKAAARSYHFEWPSPPKIEAVQLRVQVPLAAKNLSTQPKTTHISKSRRGLSSQRLDVGVHAAGQPLRFHVTYENESGRLSADLLRKQSGGPPTASGTPPAAPPSSPPVRTTTLPRPTQDDPFMRWLLIGLASAGVLFVVVMVWGGKNEEQDPKGNKGNKGNKGKSKRG